jgi:glutaminase
MKNTIDYKKVLEGIYKSVRQVEDRGEVAKYIPELAKVNPDNFGISFLSKQGEAYGFGDWQTKFSIQSIAKVLSLSLAYKLLGDKVWERVGVEPSGSSFNSLVQLETDNGIPRNPFINGGAMVICDMLISNLDNPKEDFLAFVREVSNCRYINFSLATAKSEERVGYRNNALCNFIKSFGNMENHPDEVLDFYFHMCSIEMTCQELAKTISFLAFCEYTTESGNPFLNLSEAKRINAIMQTCGFYDESGEFSFKVGLPGKSGVGGGIVAIYPEIYCIAVWSPKLNKKGNSFRGMKFLEAFTTETELSIF